MGNEHDENWVQILLPHRIFFEYSSHLLSLSAWVQRFVTDEHLMYQVRSHESDSHHLSNEGIVSSSLTRCHSANQTDLGQMAMWHRYLDSVTSVISELEGGVPGTLRAVRSSHLYSRSLMIEYSREM